ncbi:NADH-ubiquinone oxidoreductase chain L [[Actinomadura] parvosata subsp. kistnae]|uniref:NADH dehydrogenase n=1 Tax=[Actinomadura] parvosata subsp. kistnae TaxID=1909395 RepID=A0A1V0A015_9ACTN|nr:proton-conducting transporter membrane subunit [Nonomuraea sp. ATCC 55076]AQZ63530.1 NADH dehydrogenase [Nonomuraea sp. ATCC 55076]SPL99284.1 NADH-ubiquinone oxidoreductase chain L [Actinomadura parvosata subsp. kistnae]
MTLLAPLLPALPVVAGGALLLVRRAAPAVALLVAAVTVVQAVLAAVVRPALTFEVFTGYQAGLAVDGLSAVMVVTVAVIALAVLVFAAGEIHESEGRFFGLMLIFTGAMLLTVTATDLVLLLMAWEVMGAMSYALIGFRWRDPGRVRSGTLAFVTTRAGDLGLYLAAGGAVAGAHTLTLASLTTLNAPWLHLVTAGLVAAALGKSAQLPFSFWLSRAMAGPSPVSALLHSATMVAAGAYLLLRTAPVLAATGWAGPLVAWAGAATALLLGAVAVAQRDLKQLLAASTCAQLGFMVLAAGVPAVAGGTAQLVAHAAVKSLLFLGAGAWLSTLGTQRLAELRGAARRYPLVGVTFGIGALALAGLPPLSLWVTKDAVLAAVDDPVLSVVSLAAGALAAAYAAKALITVWLPAPEQRDAAPLGLLERLPLPPLALLAASLGILGLPALFDAWARLLGAPGPVPEAGELAWSGLLALAVVLLVIRARGAFGEIGVLTGWLRLEPLAVAAIWRPLTAAARALARFDDHVIDGAVRTVARAAKAAARIARSPFESGVDGLVRAAAGGVGRLGALARKPQTGQVHTYLAQATVAAAVLAIVIVLVR